MRAVVVWPAAVRNRLRWLTLTPFDGATAEGRANERHRRVVLSAGAAALARVFGLGATILSIPLALSYLGSERFGIWSVLSSLVATLQFADLGVGNGIVNSVSHAHGKGDRAGVAMYASSGLLTLTAIATAVLVSIPAIVVLVPWPDLLKLTGALAVHEVRSAVAVFLICIALSMPLGLVPRVQIGLQRSFVVSMWQCAANIVAVLSIWLATYLQLGLAWLVLALLGVPLLMAAVNAVVFFASETDLRPNFRLVAAGAVKKLLSTGSGFLVLQISAAVVLSSDSIVIASALGASYVADYAVPEKLFSIVSVLVATAISPLWPAYGEAIARGDIAWVKHTLKRSMLFAVAVSGAASISLLALGPWIVEKWIGSSVVVNQRLFIMLAAWKVLECAGMALAMFLNGAGAIRLQVISCCCMVLAIVLFKFPIVHAFGIAGAPAATASIYLIIAFIPLLLLIPRTLRDIKHKHGRLG